MQEDQKPKEVMIVLRINYLWRRKLRIAGIDLTLRGRASKKIKQQSRSEETRKHVDKAGIERYSTGVPVFGWGKSGGQNISPRYLVGDIQQLFGFFLNEIYIRQKPGEWMNFLYLRFGPRPRRNLSQEQIVLITQLLRCFYEHTHIYLNPDSSISVTCAHILDGTSKQLEEKLSEATYVRISSHKQFILQPRE